MEIELGKNSQFCVEINIMTRPPIYIFNSGFEVLRLSLSSWRELLLLVLTLRLSLTELYKGGAAIGNDTETIPD